MQGNSVVIKYIVMLPQPAATAPYFTQLYSSTSVRDSVNLTLFLKSPLFHILLFQHFLNCIRVNLVFYGMLTNSFKNQPRIYSQNFGYYFSLLFRCTVHIYILNILRNFVRKKCIQLNLTQHFPYLCYDGNHISWLWTLCGKFHGR